MNAPYGQLSPQAVERMDGLAHLKALEELRSSIRKLTEDFLEEGFDLEDCVDYIRGTLFEIVDDIYNGNTDDIFNEST